MSQLIVASRPDGLGTRLLTIVFARLLAERLNVDLKVLWPSLQDDLYNFPNLLQAGSEYDVFESRLIFADKKAGFGEIVDESILAGLQRFTLSGSGVNFENTTIEELTSASNQSDYIFYDLPFLLSQISHSADDSLESVKKYWRSIKFNGDVMQAYENAHKRYDLNSSIVVHLRRGDIVKMPVEANIDKLLGDGCTQIFQRFLPLETAIEMIEANSNDSQVVVVCSEDEKLVNELSSKMPFRTVISFGGSFEPNSTKSALLDLLVMSACQTLISPYKSYFSECAAIVGRCNHLTSGLDIKRLLTDLAKIINTSNCRDKNSRLAAIMVTGWQNLWHEPGEYRDEILKEAKLADPAIVRRMLG